MTELEQRRRNAEQGALRELNAIFGSLFSNRAAWHYYTSKNKTNKSREQDRYFYTASKVKHGEGEKYLSGVYRYNASKKTWKATKKAGHRTKRQAMNRALQLRDKEARGL